MFIKNERKENEKKMWLGENDPEKHPILSAAGC
jgi:hypothetical protein